MNDVASRSRRVLVIAHAFPPCGGAGVQRTAKLVSHLPANGWTPTVLTVLPATYGLTDDSLYSSAEFRALDVVRTSCFDPVAQYASGPQPTAAGATPASTSGGVLRRGVRRAARSAWTIAEEHLLVPDRSILWFRSAVRAAHQIHRHRPFDLVYATGEPYSAYLIARRVAERFDVPYVLDMRDPWTQVPYRQTPRSRVRRAIERRLERTLLEGCAACVFANGSIDAYRRAFQRLNDRLHLVPNGYDPADLDGVVARSFDRFTIVHNGTFLPGYRTADVFLNALAEWIRRDPSLPEKVQVFFVGRKGEETELIARLGLSRIVHQTGYLSHRESLQYLLGADALLLIGGRHRWEETGKIFEYLAAAKPILALVQPDGAAAEMLRRAPSARVVDRESVTDAGAALTMLAAAGRAGVPVEAPSWLADFERGRLSSRIASIFDACVPSWPRAAAPASVGSAPRAVAGHR